MPARQRTHLHRLSNVWVSNPTYFLTVCVAGRRELLARTEMAEMLIRSWCVSPDYHGWHVGRYVIMPDHVHFFARPRPDAKALSDFMRDWKKWTTREATSIIPIQGPLWQREFFDHLLRSTSSYSAKWDYVYENPVRAGLSPLAELWPYSGECEFLTY